MDTRPFRLLARDLRAIEDRLGTVDAHLADADRSLELAAQSVAYLRGEVVRERTVQGGGFRLLSVGVGA